MHKRWDIFCKVVDNFGDIGVCWRLARQLHVEHGLQIRLWIDDLEAAQAIIPSLNVVENSQVCEEITILKWNAEADFSQAAEVVIEAFTCELPSTYLAAMARQKSKWVNLEYLSAETWVADFHAKPSPQTNGLTRYFYFPGFTEATGGLIRERNVEVGRETKIESTLKISLFCYPNAPIHDLFTALQQYLLSPQNIPAEAGYSCVKTNIHAVCVYVPATSILQQIADYFGVETITAGDYFSRDNLHVHILPFLSQADYDVLLCDCDLNFVRGEDSWIRAIWAGKPFIWQSYMQAEDTHITKLNAFLDAFYADSNEKDMIWKAHGYWAAGHVPKGTFEGYLTYLPTIQAYTLQQSQQLAKQQDLATKLVDFCNNIVFLQKNDSRV